MLTKTCRVCGRSNLSETSKNLFETSNRKFVRHIQMITGLRLRNMPDAPDSICFCCQSDLKLAMSFRRLCSKTQKKWQSKSTIEIQENSSQSEPEITTPVPVSVADPTSQIGYSSQRNCTNISTYRESDTDSDLEPQQTIEIMLNECKKLECAEVTEEHDHLDQDYIIKTAIEINTDASNKSEDSEEDKTNDTYTPSNTLIQSKKEYTKLLRAKPELAIYICELCGSHANSKASFERHIRKHTGERPFACDECESRFLSAAELRAHGLKHSGERPFPCRYCDRRYVSYMGRVKHERIHTNERPFVCAECGKAFTNAYILKNHMLVHTGERHFCCELCERSFQRKTHLRTHFRSNTHKQNMAKQQYAR